MDGEWEEILLNLLWFLVVILGGLLRQKIKIILKEKGSFIFKFPLEIHFFKKSFFYFVFKDSVKIVYEF